jgi:EAL domain-containing protein (putative c-di-GMP-specific phosphodiesterase class I)
MRWEHPERGLIPPALFIPIAEESGQVQSLGAWVLEEACRQMVDWLARRIVPDTFAISVNISKVELTMPGFADHVAQVVRDAGLSPAHIKIEVTETTLVDNRAGVAGVLQELRDRGFTVMMDDFGTGHSSLSGLHALPIDELKIDQSFIRHEEANRKVIAITSSIVTLATHLNLKTVGEGIESVAHAALLQDMGCNFGQGYYFAKPLPAADFEAWYNGDDLRQAA